MKASTMDDRNVTNDELARKQADETIQRLVDYLRTIQPDYDKW
jgi:hypothetical protein